MTFHDLASCDLHQMSELILALERDIPKWRHVWMADVKLRKEKAKIGERLVSSLQQFRYDWMSEEGQNDEKRIERFRIKYYNLQACKMCLDNDNPFWENKKTEAENSKNAEPCTWMPLWSSGIPTLLTSLTDARKNVMSVTAKVRSRSGNWRSYAISSVSSSWSWRHSSMP